MEKEKKFKNIFKYVEPNKISNSNLSQDNEPIPPDIQKENIKINDFQNNNNNSKNNSNFGCLNSFNDQMLIKDKNSNNLKIIYINLKKQLTNINNKIIENGKSIEKLNNSLNKLKLEKNNKKIEVINFLSNKESLDEIYNNYIDYLKNNNKENKEKIKKYNCSKPNPFENKDEDEFEILISEIKEIDLNKFIEQTFNFIEDIFDNPSKQMKLSLKEIINKSYSQFNEEISSSPFIDTYSIVSNFFLKISLFLSNQSHGKYSETIINLFLRCLVKMNSINIKNEELINYMNTKYKEEKEKLKQQINILNKKEEILCKTKIAFENKIKDIESQLQIIKNKEVIYFRKINNNISNFKNFTHNNDIDNFNLINNYNKSNKNSLINNDIKINKHKKNENKGKTKVINYINKFKKIYKEDENNTNSNENIFNSININEYQKIINEKINKDFNKLYNSYNEKIKEININKNYSFNTNTNINEDKKENNLEIDNIKPILNKNYIKFNTIGNKEEVTNNEDILNKNSKNSNIKKYNTINNYDISKNNISNKGCISPEIKKKKKSYFKDIIQNEKNMKLDYKEKNCNQEIIERIYYNRKNKASNNKPQLKKLNYHYIMKKINNNIFSNNIINKNMKFDLAKKINYLEKVNKSNTYNNIQIKNISMNNKLFERNLRLKRLLTEKKEKKFKYNFFDIIQEANKKRNKSGENNYKNLNKLNSSNCRNYFKKEKKNINKENNNNNNDKQLSLNKNYDYILKTDYIIDKTKSFYNNYDKKFFKLINKSNSKEVKNGNESENNFRNGSDISYNLNDFSFPLKNKFIIEYKNKGKKINIKNNNKKHESNNLIKKNINFDRNHHYQCSKKANNSSEKKDCLNKAGYKCQSLRKEKNSNNINKEIKKNNIYFIITESVNSSKKYNKLLSNIFKNDNIDNQNSKSRSQRSAKNKTLNKEMQSYSIPKRKISNFDNKFNKTLLLQRSFSSTINKLLNKNKQKRYIIDSGFENNINNNNSSMGNNSFNSLNNLCISFTNSKKKIKEINSYNDKNKKYKITKAPISNLKVGKKNNIYNNDTNKKNNILNNNEKNSNNYLRKDKYDFLYKKYKKIQKETFCYFKIFESDFKNNNIFNPLENCSINPEKFGYCEGYISIDIYSGNIKITPKLLNHQNSTKNKNIIENILFSKIKKINYNYNTISRDESNKIKENLYNNIKESYLNIELKEIRDIDQTLVMNNIIKIHRILIKYTSGQKNNNNNFINNSQKNDKKALDLNKLIYLREIKEINMQQNEKIKAILCNYFSFSFIFEKNNKTKIELIFINFEQYNLWNLFINEIVNINNKINKNQEEVLEINNNIIESNACTHIKGNIVNGSTINEDTPKISNIENILIV